MKLMTIFKIVLVVFVITASFLAGKELQKRNNQKLFAEWNQRLAESEALRIEANTLQIEGQNKLQNEIDQKNYELEFAKKKYAKLESDFYFAYQDPNIPDASVDELIIFTPDITEPEIIEIVKEVQIAVVDSCIYPYKDVANNYFADFRIKYDSQDGLFFITPENMNLKPSEQEYKRNTSLTVTWYGNTSGTVNFQHDILEFLPIGFSAGSINDKFLAGATIGIRF